MDQPVKTQTQFITLQNIANAMIPVPINEAEAIFAPFFDGGDSDMRTDKASLLEQFAVNCGEGVAARAVQTWCGVDVVIDRAPVGQTALTLTSLAGVQIAGYDVFRLFACIPSYVRLRVTGVQGGCVLPIVDSHVGNDTHEEIDGPITGAHLDAFHIEFSLLEARPATVALRWLGLANSEAQARLEARKSPYTPDWPHCLVLNDPEDAAPEIGMLLGADELDALRAQCLSGPFKPLCDALRQQLQQYLTCEPEQMIGYLAPAPDLRWTRVRDNWKQSLYHVMEPLALLGLIDRNPAMSRIAVRMALSLAHCTHWCESPMGVHPGASWHHRSFQETYYTAACALVLDWAGAWITPHGKQIIRDAMVMKGLPRIESDFKRMEYIRYMNQGIVFSIGRILGLLSLLPAYPRYATQLAEAECDLHEMINNYIQQDGAILEGPAYWAHSFLDIIPLYFALARYHGRALKEYATEKILRAGDFALSLLTTIGDGAGYLGINDAHNQGRYPLHVIIAYAIMSERSEWRRMLSAQVHAAAAEGSRDAMGNAFALVMAANGSLDVAVEEPAGQATSRFDLFPVGGQAASVRRDAHVGAVHLHLCSGPTYPGHYHEDKGSVILEAAGQALLIDRGVLAYHEAENAFLHSAAAHNILYPEPPADGVPFAQPSVRVDASRNRPWGTIDLATLHGGQLGTAIEVCGIVLLACDNAPAWPDGLFNLNIRRICSPDASLFLIEDVVEAGQPLAMSFRLHTAQAAELCGQEAWIRTPAVALRVAAVNWAPECVDIAPCSINDHHRPVTLVRLLSAKSSHHRLLTVLELLPANATAGRWQITAAEGNIRAECAEMHIHYTCAADGSAQVYIQRENTVWCAQAIGRDWIQCSTDGSNKDSR